MKLFKAGMAWAVAAGLALAAGPAWAQEKKDEKKPEAKPAPKPAEIKPAPGKEGQPPTDAAHDEMMKMMMEAGKPGPHHEKLKFFVGNWKASVKSWMGGPEPQVSEGTATIESIYGGRFIKETFKGTFMDMPFEGTGVQGYDNISKKHVGTWCDNMSTSIATSEGTCDPSGKVFTFTMTCNDPMTGKPQQSNAVKKITGENSFTLTMSGPGPDGKEAPMMEITYTRQ